MVTFKVFVEQTWNGGMVNVFAPTISDPAMGRGPRHRGLIKDIPLNRQHAITVPKYKQAKSDFIKQIESLKNSSFVKMPLSLANIRKIAKKFRIFSIPKTKTTKLKNLNLGITWDANIGQFILHKL
jgi:hypothetical protein